MPGIDSPCCGLIVDNNALLKLIMHFDFPASHLFIYVPAKNGSRASTHCRHRVYPEIRNTSLLRNRHKYLQHPYQLHSINPLLFAYQSDLSLQWELNRKTRGSLGIHKVSYNSIYSGGSHCRTHLIYVFYSCIMILPGVA